MLKHFSSTKLARKDAQTKCEQFRLSTEMALIRLIDQLRFDLDGNRTSRLVFIDDRKAFDLIDHRILLTKLESMELDLII